MGEVDEVKKTITYKISYPVFKNCLWDAFKYFVYWVFGKKPYLLSFKIIYIVDTTLCAKNEIVYGKYC